MRLQLFLGFLVAGLAVLLAPGYAFTFSNGAPANRSGAPGERTCATAGCHASFELNSGPGRVELAVPAAYAPGDTLDIDVRVVGGGIRWGFQVSVQDGNGEGVGTWLPDGNLTQLAGRSDNHVTHTRAGTAQNEWTVRWVAPDVGAGTVTFYAAGNDANGNGGSGGDFIYTSNAEVTEGTAVANERANVPEQLRITSVYPNPFADRATLVFTLAEPADVAIALVDLTGRVVWTTPTGRYATGIHEVPVRAADLPAATYLLAVRAGASTTTRTVTLLR